MPELRTFVLSRAGFAGIQRYAANWMGDNQSRWDHLWLSIPMAMRLRRVAASRSSAPTSAASRATRNAELFLRWMQYGTLTPFCRNHSEIGNVDQYAWAWGEHRARAVARDAIELRYRLLPYIYAAFVRASRDRRAGPATARLRPPGRRAGARHRRPVPVRARPARRAGGRAGETARQVYLPPGDWYDWHTGERHEAGGWVIAADADGPHPDLRPRRRRDPDVAARRRRRPTAITRRRSSCTSFPGDGRVDPARGRRADVRRRRYRTTFTLSRATLQRRT